MKTTTIVILLTVTIALLGWDIAMGLRKSRDKLWLMSAVTVPGRMALDEICSDLDHGEYATAKMKLEAFRAQWKRFDSDNSFSNKAR